nr:unnamed protein product [Callosobruchus analis]
MRDPVVRTTHPHPLPHLSAIIVAEDATKSGLAKHSKTCGQRDRSKCQHCDRSLTTFNGVRLHELRAHAAEYNDELRGEQRRPESEIFTALAAIEASSVKGEAFIKKMT